jgi:hypothetical protein
MATSFRKKSVRSSLSLFAATLLATGALLVASAGVLAAPPSPPTVTFSNVVCDGGASSTTLYFDADIDVKGKWVDLSWSTSFDTAGAQSAHMVERFDSSRTLSRSETVFEAAASASVQVTVFDRKGNVRVEATSGEAPC